MSDAVITALIMTAGTIICQILINYNNRKKGSQEEAKKEKERAAAEARQEERLQARLNSIEKNLEENNQKLDIHNGYAEKISEIQQDIAFIRGILKGDKT